MPPAPTPSRRELNKERTRRAIRESVLDLWTSRPLSQVTAEDIAERAGISRRTFFNYYAGLDAVLADTTMDSLLPLAESFLARPATEDPLTAMIAVFEAPAPLALARWSAALCVDEGEQTETYTQVWQLHTQWLEEMIRARVGAPQAEPLYVAGLAGSVIAAFSAAQAEWTARTGGRLDEESLQLLSALVRRTFAYARSGWRPPHPSLQP